MRRPRLDNANTRSRPPSEVVAHYLEAIYYIRAEGEVVRSARLAALKPGETGTITRISEVAQREAPPLLQYLHDRGLTPGTRITVQEVDEVGRTMQLRAARLLTLSSETASKLAVVRSARLKPGRARAPR